MNIVAEISMRPPQSDYIPPIDDFLAQPDSEPSVEANTDRMSTRRYGDHDAMMDLLKRTIIIAVFGYPSWRRRLAEDVQYRAAQ